MQKFDGLSVLLLEDEYLIALDAEQILKELGIKKVEIVATLDRAEQRAEDGQFDLAVLDVNINGQPSFPIAKAFGKRGVPVVFASGYELRDRQLLGFENVIHITKPYTSACLKDAICAALDKKSAPKS
jgi:DNA-binding response OmpR family regulator